MTTLDERLAAQAVRNRAVAPNKAQLRVRDLETAISGFRKQLAEKKRYHDAIMLQNRSRERAALIGELRAEIEVVVDNSEIFDALSVET